MNKIKSSLKGRLLNILIAILSVALIVFYRIDIVNQYAVLPTISIAGVVILEYSVFKHYIKETICFLLSILDLIFIYMWYCRDIAQLNVTMFFESLLLSQYVLVLMFLILTFIISNSYFRNLDDIEDYNNIMTIIRKYEGYLDYCLIIDMCLLIISAIILIVENYVKSFIFINTVILGIIHVVVKTLILRSMVIAADAKLKELNAVIEVNENEPKSSDT